MRSKLNKGIQNSVLGKRKNNENTDSETETDSDTESLTTSTTSSSKNTASSLQSEPYRHQTPKRNKVDTGKNSDTSDDDDENDDDDNKNIKSDDESETEEDKIKVKDEKDEKSEEKLYTGSELLSELDEIDWDTVSEKKLDRIIARLPDKPMEDGIYKGSWPIHVIISHSDNCGKLLARLVTKKKESFRHIIRTDHRDPDYQGNTPCVLLARLAHHASLDAILAVLSLEEKKEFVNNRATSGVFEHQTPLMIVSNFSDYQITNGEDRSRFIHSILPHANVSDVMPTEGFSKAHPDSGKCGGWSALHFLINTYLINPNDKSSSETQEFSEEALTSFAKCIANNSSLNRLEPYFNAIDEDCVEGVAIRIFLAHLPLDNEQLIEVLNYVVTKNKKYADQFGMLLTQGKDLEGLLSTLKNSTLKKEDFYNIQTFLQTLKKNKVKEINSEESHDYTEMKRSTNNSKQAAIGSTSLPDKSKKSGKLAKTNKPKSTNDGDEDEEYHPDDDRAVPVTTKNTSSRKIKKEENDAEKRAKEKIAAAKRQEAKAKKQEAEAYRELSNLYQEKADSLDGFSSLTSSSSSSSSSPQRALSTHPLLKEARYQSRKLRERRENEDLARSATPSNPVEVAKSNQDKITQNYELTRQEKKKEDEKPEGTGLDLWADFINAIPKPTPKPIVSSSLVVETEITRLMGGGGGGVNLLSPSGRPPVSPLHSPLRPIKKIKEDLKNLILMGTFDPRIIHAIRAALLNLRTFLSSNPDLTFDKLDKLQTVERKLLELQQLLEKAKKASIADPTLKQKVEVLLKTHITVPLKEVLGEPIQGYPSSPSRHSSSSNPLLSRTSSGGASAASSISSSSSSSSSSLSQASISGASSSSSSTNTLSSTTGLFAKPNLPQRFSTVPKPSGTTMIRRTPQQSQSLSPPPPTGANEFSIPFSPLHTVVAPSNVGSGASSPRSHRMPNYWSTVSSQVPIVMLPSTLSSTDSSSKKVDEAPIPNPFSKGPI